MLRKERVYRCRVRCLPVILAGPSTQKTEFSHE